MEMIEKLMVFFVAAINSAGTDPIKAFIIKGFGIALGTSPSH